jgi:hypothetical protein
MKHIIILTALFVALTGCARHNVQQYSQVDQGDKSVTVPAGAEGLKGDLKKALAALGWRMVVAAGPVKTEGTLGKETVIESYRTYTTRYKLLVASDQVGTCHFTEPRYAYEVSFIDTQTGGEVFTVNGRGCQSDAVEKFKMTLTDLAN